MFQKVLWVLDVMQVPVLCYVQAVHVPPVEDVSDVDTLKSLAGTGNQNLANAKHAKLKLQCQLIH